MPHYSRRDEVIAPEAVASGDGTVYESVPPSASASGFSALDLDDRVVIALLFNEVVRVEQVERAWARWRDLPEESRPQLWRILAEEDGMDRERVYAAAAQVFAFKASKIAKHNALGCMRRVRSEFSDKQWRTMQQLHLLPVAYRADSKRWTFVSYDPTRPAVHAFLKSLRHPNATLEYAPESFTTALIAESELLRNEYLDRVHDTEFAFDLGYERSDELVDEEALEAEISKSALVNLFEATLVEGVRRGASDIHIFPDAEGRASIHFRIDGELDCWYAEEVAHPEAFLAVVKDQTYGVDRFEREKGQDGFIQRTVDGTTIRFRVSVLPITHTTQQARYESIVIRVLDDRKVIASLADLGLPPRDLDLFEAAIRQPHGMVILTGPTGSGKSTTLYAALHEIRSPKRNVLTAEDPVEYVIPGVRQIKLSHKLGVEEALRFILRHDPDIVMVGEMRDRATAELAVQLANTGHLTFSTLHTNDAPSAVSRLYKMGIEPFLVAHSIHLVVAQRLVRVLCPDCKREATPDEATLGLLGFSAEECGGATFFEAAAEKTCKSCGGHGYKGRRAVTEMLPLTPAIQRLIVTAERVLDEEAVRAQAIKEGMTTLHAAARAAVLRGETSVQEIARSVGSTARAHVAL